ncbi:4Fe-4S ferredoxin-type domain-containing protein [Entamoeba marina]
MKTIIVNYNKCVGCGDCSIVCNKNIIVNSKGKYIISDEKATLCKHCGHCSAICEHGAISLYGKTPNLQKHAMSNIVDVIKTRRSIRHYKNKIPNDELLNIINITRRNAPHIIVSYVDYDCNSTNSVDSACIMLSHIELVAVFKGYGTFWCGLLTELLQHPECMEVIGLKGKRCLHCMGIGVPSIQYVREVPRQNVDMMIIE